MFIKEIFEADIERDIKGVIKVGQADEENEYQELKEYVVTKELKKHFRDFFTNYQKGINGYTDKMGVWISGFFGSGKSHFLKILSYLLKNDIVEGKKAIDYFIDGKKIDDPMVLAEMNNASNCSNDVMLFNIDSKGSSKVGTGKDAIIEVFLKVFNEMQGYCGIRPYIADFERQLDEEGVYEKFKEKFKEITGNEWVKKRQSFSMIQDKIVKTLVQCDIISEESARDWCKNIKNNYDISIETFVQLVKNYCDSKGSNHHIVFLVDEIGQYIAEDTKLMLNLQTITEDLGTACKGKVWIIVTSQQDIDSITKTKGNDFSKIQGRFDTRLSLSSANVDEVIRKRILKKKDYAAQTLRLLYEKYESILKNLIIFTNDTPYKKLYENSEEFQENYPFIPYQFNLLGQVLTAIRTHGASGKHLAEGERSMLALFQEAAQEYKDCEEGVLIPFNIFYKALDKFIDHTHRIVISQAEENKNLEKFDVEILKVLFMIKYVKEIKGNIDNLTTLMVSNINDDRLTLRKKVEESLHNLRKEELIQKNGDIYVFLTNEEQEINNAINNQIVEPAEVISETQNIIFGEILTKRKYSYSSRYLFSFNQKIDDSFYKSNQSNNIGLHIITPYNEDLPDPALKMLSTQENSVIMKLPNDGTFLEEITESLKITKFLKSNSGNIARNFESILRAKEDERIEKQDRIKIFIEDALKNAIIYVNGDNANISAKDPVTRVDEAMEKLVAMNYSKLSYMETEPTLSDIAAIFKDDKGQISWNNIDKKLPNQLALDEVLSRLRLYKQKHIKISLKSIIDDFSKAPYGFINEDVQWLIATLFKEGKISLNINSRNITLIENDSEEIIRYLTKKEFIEKLIIDIREKATKAQISSVKEVINEYFGMTISSNDDDVLMKNFKNCANNKIENMKSILVEYRVNPKLPEEFTIKKAIKDLEQIIKITEPKEFFKTVYYETDDLLDMSDEIAPIIEFFKGEQRGIYETTCKYINMFENSKNFVSDTELLEVFNTMNMIVKENKPYNDIPKLPKLNNEFQEKYYQLLENEAKALRPVLEHDKEVVFNTLKEKNLEAKFIEKFEKAFKEIEKKLEESNEIAQVKNIKLESDTLKQKCLDEIQNYEDILEMKKIKEEEEKKLKDNNNASKKIEKLVKPKKTVKNITMAKITDARTYTFSSEKDIDEFLLQVKEKLLKELNDENTIVKLS